MKRMRNISGLYSVSAVLCVLSALAVSLASQAQDYTRLSERTLMGTARYVGMGGAMTAVGGDPTSVMDNVAGLGLYRRMEVLLTLDHAGYLMAPQASVVLTLPTDRLSLGGVQFHNFMFSYHRVHSYNRSLSFSSAKDPSLGALFAAADGYMGIPFCADRTNMSSTMRLSESGYVNQYTFDWAMNISDRWYWGLGLHVHSFHFSSNGDYMESFDRPSSEDRNQYNASTTTVIIDGAGCSLASGLIARPLSWLRLGLSIETPSVGHATTITKGTFEALTDSVRWSDAPTLTETVRTYHMPLHLSTSVAFQISRYALIALQYDFRHMNYRPDMHSLRAGLEVVPIEGLYINAGYAFESPFSRQALSVAIDPSLNRQDAYFQDFKRQQFISCAVGYRGRHLIAQLAYQYRMQHFDFYAHSNAAPHTFDTNTHRVVLTIGWHRYYNE